MNVLLFLLIFLFTKPVKADFSYQFVIPDNEIDFQLDKTRNVDKIEDLFLVREKDQSLTVLFSNNISSNEFREYSLFCEETKEEFLLIKTNYFFKEEIKYLSVFDQELIFNLNNCDCPSKLAVYSKDPLGMKSALSDLTTIISYQDLDF